MNNETLSVSEFKNITGLTRKNAIPILEYLDKCTYTIRNGAERLKGIILLSKSSKTPLMVQYDEIKSNYSDSILLFRMGDFYETFGQDATIASEILGIVLTKRSNGKASDVNLAGFPYHSLDNYLPKLIKAGHKVAICEQIEDPSK